MRKEQKLEEFRMIGLRSVAFVAVGWALGAGTATLPLVGAPDKAIAAGCAALIGVGVIGLVAALWVLAEGLASR